METPRGYILINCPCGGAVKYSMDKKARHVAECGKASCKAKVVQAEESHCAFIWNNRTSPQLKELQQKADKALNKKREIDKDGKETSSTTDQGADS